MADATVQVIKNLQTAGSAGLSFVRLREAMLDVAPSKIKQILNGMEFRRQVTFSSLRDVFIWQSGGGHAPPATVISKDSAVVNEEIPRKHQYIKRSSVSQSDKVLQHLATCSDGASNEEMEQTLGIKEASLQAVLSKLRRDKKVVSVNDAMTAMSDTPRRHYLSGKEPVIPERVPLMTRTDKTQADIVPGKIPSFSELQPPDRECKITIVLSAKMKRYFELLVDEEGYGETTEEVAINLVRRGIEILVSMGIIELEK